MTTSTADSAIAEARTAVDRSMATSLVTEDPNDRPFLLEGLVIGATIFLLEKYAEGFLEGLGLQSAARAHGERARRFLRGLRGREDVDAAIAAERPAVEEILEEVRGHPATDDAQAAGRRAVAEAVAAAGAGNRQAADVAAQVERAALGS